MTPRGWPLAAVCALLAIASHAHAQGDPDAGVPDGGYGLDMRRVADADAGAPDAGPVQPTRTPPHLIEAPPITLPEGTEPVPAGSSVELVLTITADGTVSDAAIGTPLREDIDAIVLAAAPQMRFEPATRDGTPVPARIRFRYALAVPEPVHEASESESAGASERAEATESAGASESAAATESAGETEPVEAALADEEIASYSASGTAERPEPGAATRMTFTGAELSTVPGTFGDPVRVLQLMPGVSRTPYGVPLLIVRGAGLNNTGYFIDGFPVPNLWHFFLGPTVVNTNFITRQDFYPGNYPVRFGRFSQAVVSLETSAPTGPTHLELQVDALRSQAYVSIPFDNGRGNISFAGRRSYFELITPLITQATGQAIPSVVYDDYQARIEYHFDDHFSASLFVFGSDDSLDASSTVGSGATSANSQTSISYSFQRAIARLEWHVGDTTARLSGTVGRDATGFTSAQAAMARQVFQFENFIAALRLDIATTIAPWLRMNYGIDASGTSFGVNVTAPVPLGLGYYDNPSNFDPQLVAIQSRVALGTPGAYGEAVLNFAPVEISLGVRADILRYGLTTNIAPDPRGVVRVHLTDDVTAIASTGLFTQPPQVFQTLGVAGNPRLGPQRSWQTSAQLEANLPLGIYARVTGFFTYLWDIARLHESNPSGGTARQFFSADEQGRSYGLEALVRRPLADGFYGWLSYTLSRSERVDPGGSWYTFGFDQTHILNVAASYEFDGWRFGASLQVTTGRPTLSVCATTYDSESNAYDPTFCDRGARLPTYVQLNVRIDRDFNIENTLLGSIYIDVLNVLDSQNAEAVIYQYDYQRTMPLPGLPILGTIGIRAYWEPR
jgi:hypothetical protein